MVDVRKHTRNRFDEGRRKNLEMNPETYAMRRKVMNHIYRARELVPELPRVGVRITEDAKSFENGATILGTAAMNDYIIWICKSSVERPDLKYVVFHELVHTFFKYGHSSDKKSLMYTSIQKMTDSEIEKDFVRYSQLVKK